jgi:hypothetical protein
MKGLMSSSTIRATINAARLTVSVVYGFPSHATAIAPNKDHELLSRKLKASTNCR